LLVVGLLVFSALAAGGLLSIAEPQTSEPPATAVELPQVPAATAGLPTGSTPPTAAAVSPAVATARALVEQDPSNSVAHLALARALWTANQARAAFETLTQAANLAGPTNRDFFLRAALDFRSLGAWTAAGAMYLRAVQTYPVGAAPHDLMQQLNEAVYRAAEQPDMPLFLFFERIDQASQPLGFIARSRHALYNGAVSDAKMNLELARRLKPELLEAFLLESEIALREGRLVDAEPVLISLSGDLGAPAWVREFASELLASLP
jgi:tetratricopeptide (TPR) repeat protein